MKLPFKLTVGLKISLGIAAIVALAMLTLLTLYMARQLVEGATAFGAGNLGHHIPELGDDELGDAARQFNQMAGRLQPTSVSRDSLEYSEALLRDSEERYERAARGANDGLFDWDEGTGKVYYSPRWKAMLDYADDEIGDTPQEWLRRVHPDDLTALNQHLASDGSHHRVSFQAEYRMRQKNGYYLWVQCRYVGAFRRRRVRHPVGQCAQFPGSADGRWAHSARFTRSV